jgi:hypothetical protein
MGLNFSQQFLVEAARAAGSGDYFRWEAVGISLGLSPSESDQAVRSLNDRKLVILLLEGDARLLEACRQLATRLAARESDGSRKGSAAGVPKGIKASARHGP